MQLTSCQHSTGAVWADALFASALQRSDNPDAGQVRQATAATVRAYGAPGCAERVAQEFGDHPTTLAVGKCPGRAPGHVIGARLREGRFEGEWLFLLAFAGQRYVRKFGYQSGRPEMNRRPLTPSHVPGVAGRGSVSLSGHLTRLDSRLASLGVA
jgi:hypothetical protein